MCAVCKCQGVSEGQKVRGRVEIFQEIPCTGGPRLNSLTSEAEKID